MVINHGCPSRGLLLVNSILCYHISTPSDKLHLGLGLYCFFGRDSSRYLFTLEWTTYCRISSSVSQNCPNCSGISLFSDKRVIFNIASFEQTCCLPRIFVPRISVFPYYRISKAERLNNKRGVSAIRSSKKGIYLPNDSLKSPGTNRLVF